MQPMLSALLAAGLVAALAYAVWTDLRRRVIPNPLNAGIALAAPLWWWATGLQPWPGIAVQVAVAAAALAVFVGLFAAGAMGGGDVKLIAALALWLLPLDFLSMLMGMAIAGGLVTLVAVLHHNWTKREGRPEVPYGVAIAIAAMPIFAQRYLYQFGS